MTVKEMFELSIIKYKALSGGAEPGDWRGCAFCAHYHFRGGENGGCRACQLDSCDVCALEYHDWDNTHDPRDAKAVLGVIEREFKIWKEKGNV